MSCHACRQHYIAVKYAHSCKSARLPTSRKTKNTLGPVQAPILFNPHSSDLDLHWAHNSASLYFVHSQKRRPHPPDRKPKDMHTSNVTCHWSRLVHHLQPQYEIPHRTASFTTVVPELYQSTVDLIKTEISADPGAGLEFIPFTTDMWTSRDNQGGYISLTCYYLAQSFAIKAFTMAYTHMLESHTAGGATSRQLSRKRALDLNAVPVYVVTDNGWNIRKLMWLVFRQVNGMLQKAWSRFCHPLQMQL